MLKNIFIITLLLLSPITYTAQSVPTATITVVHAEKSPAELRKERKQQRKLERKQKPSFRQKHPTLCNVAIGIGAGFVGAVIAVVGGLAYGLSHLGMLPLH